MAESIELVLTADEDHSSRNAEYTEPLNNLGEKHRRYPPTQCVHIGIPDGRSIHPNKVAFC
jgi:hypothetical protein